MTCLLIVEDDPSQAQALARAFQRLRPELLVLTASNGADALGLIREREVDLVLTDLQMPEMNGFELLARVATNHPELPVCVMSAFGTQHTAAELKSLGALDYFSKPLNPRVALERLSEALNESVGGHVRNVSLASFLQLLEMERKTCELRIEGSGQRGLLTVRKGKLVHAECAELRGKAAAIAIIAWSNPSIVISRGSELGPATIEEPLGFVLMEAMRVEDEAARVTALARGSLNSLAPTARRSHRPSGHPPALASTRDAIPSSPPWALPTGARALAVVDIATGIVHESSCEADCPIAELACMAAQVLRHEAATLEMCTPSEGIEELVFCTTSRCDVIRTLGAGSAEFALIVFAPQETNLVIARLELERFLAARR